MEQLILYENYSRKDVHDIFAPDTPFTPSRGAWGMQGIIKIPDRPKDFIFFSPMDNNRGSMYSKRELPKMGSFPI